MLPLRGLRFWLDMVAATLGVIVLDCTQCLTCAAYCGGVLTLSLMLAKWFAPARLETRTKESNMCASIVVANHGAQ